MTEVKTENVLEQKTIQIESLSAFTLHRDELTPEIRDYADNLNRQIQNAFAEKGVKSIEELEEAARSNRISIDELVEMENLTRRLSVITKTGEIPEEETKYAEENALKNLKELAESWIPQHRKLEEDPNNKLDNLLLVLEPLVASKVHVPSECFLRNHHLGQKFLEELLDLLPQDFKPDAGLIVSIILNNSLENIQKEKSDDYHQVFSLKEDNSYIGYKLSKGKLIITGEAAQFIGYRMDGGEIIADKADHGIGAEMTNGIIRVNEAGSDAGSYMTGGKLYIKKAFDRLGVNMKGGEIEALQAGEAVGTYMRGGKIKVLEKAGDFLGMDMINGEIFAENTRNYVGTHMKGGNITIINAGDNIGEKMTGGRIDIEGSCELDTIYGNNVYFKGEKVS